MSETNCINVFLSWPMPSRNIEIEVEDEDECLAYIFIFNHGGSEF